MRKRRTISIAVGAISLAVTWFVFLRPPDEPKYQGRYLSEWVEAHRRSLQGAAQVAEFRRAIEAMGTNAVPCYLRWMRYDPQRWRIPLQQMLPRWISTNRTVRDWLVEKPSWRAIFADHGFQALGSNAVIALPELAAMMQDSNNPTAALRASAALKYLTEPAKPHLLTNSPAN
jgi:hypothetical protein